MSRRKLLKGGAVLAAGNALSAAASFLRNLIVARLVSVEDFGVVVLLSMTLSIVESVSNLAIDRLLVQAPDGDDPQLQDNAHALQVMRGVIGGIVVFTTAELVAALFKIPHATWAFHVLALVLVIRSFAHLDTVRFQREMHYQPTFWVEVFPQAISLAISVPLAYLLRDYSAIVWAMLAHATMHVMITHLLATRPYRWSWEQKTVYRILSFGWPLLASGLLIVAIFQGDKAVIAVAFSPEVVGWYGAAFMLSMAPAALVTSVMQSLLLPVLSRCQGAPDEFLARYIQVVQSCLIVGLLTAVAFIVFGPELLIALFGSRYQAGTEVAILFGLTQGVRIAKAGQFVSSVALARTKDLLISNLARGAALLLAIVLVALNYGPTAVAWTGLLGEAISYVVAMRLLSGHVRQQVIHQLPQLVVWLVLAGLSLVVGNELRDMEALLFRLSLETLWLIVTALVFVSVSPVLRGGLIRLFRGNTSGEL